MSLDELMRRDHRACKPGERHDGEPARSSSWTRVRPRRPTERRLCGCCASASPVRQPGSSSETRAAWPPRTRLAVRPGQPRCWPCSSRCAAARHRAEDGDHNSSMPARLPSGRRGTVEEYILTPGGSWQALLSIFRSAEWLGGRIEGLESAALMESPWWASIIVAAVRGVLAWQAAEVWRDGQADRSRHPALASRSRELQAAVLGRRAVSVLNLAAWSAPVPFVVDAGGLVPVLDEGASPSPAAAAASSSPCWAWCCGRPWCAGGLRPPDSLGRSSLSSRPLRVQR